MLAVPAKLGLVTGPHSWSRQAYSPVYAVMDGHELIALFVSRDLAEKWIKTQRTDDVNPGNQLRATMYTVEEKPVWQVLPDSSRP
jgi:hypothetical protein